MKKINFTLAGKKVVEKWKIWISISLSIVAIALIAFSIFAGVNKDAGRGVNVGIDFTGGNIVTIQNKISKGCRRRRTRKRSYGCCQRGAWREKMLK